jgi:hypothetical protein
MIQKGTKTLVALYVIFAVTLWSLDYFQIDIEPLIGWLGLPADFLGATGIAGGVGLTTFQVIRTAQLGLQTTSQNSVKIVNESLLGMINQVNQTNANNAKLERKLNELSVLMHSIIEFDKLLAEKNKSSRLLNDESKAHLDKWIQTTELRIKELENESL